MQYRLEMVPTVPIVPGEPIARESWPAGPGGGAVPNQMAEAKNYEDLIASIPEDTEVLSLGPLAVRYYDVWDTSGEQAERYFSPFKKLPSRIRAIQFCYDNFGFSLAVYPKSLSAFAHVLPQSVVRFAFNFEEQKQRVQFDFMSSDRMSLLISSLPYNIQCASFEPEIRPTQRTSEEQQKLRQMLQKINIQLEGNGPLPSDPQTPQKLLYAHLPMPLVHLVLDYCGGTSPLNKGFQKIIDEFQYLCKKTPQPKNQIQALSALITLISEAYQKKTEAGKFLDQLRSWKAKHIVLFEQAKSYWPKFLQPHNSAHVLQEAFRDLGLVENEPLARPQPGNGA